MADLQGWSRGTWGEGDWGEFIPVQVTGVSARTAISNVTHGLTVNATRTAFTSVSLTDPNVRSNDITFQTDSTGILLKSSYSDGEIWFEFGGTGNGVYSGIAKINNQYYIRFRCGNGGTGYQVQSDSTAFAVVNLAITDSSVSNFFDDQRHVVTWSIDVTNNRLYVWIDNTLVINYDASANSGSVTAGNGEWSGSDIGSFGQGFNTIAGGTSTYDSGATQYQYSGPSSTIESGSGLFQLNGVTANTQNYPVETNASALVEPTGVSSGVVLGTAIGEAESIYPVTGVQSNTATGTLEAQEGHGVQPTGVEMVFADGTEEIIATVDAGWGRNTWGSFAWGENITIFANLVGQELSTDIGTVTTQTGTGVDAPVTGNEVSTTLGTVSLQTDQVISVTGFNINALLQNPTILADGNVTTSAPGDQMDTAIGSVNINIFTQVDATAVTSTFDTGTLGVSGDANFFLTGAQANTDVGTVTTVTGTGVNVATTGVSIQFAEGTETISGSAVVTLTGVAMSVVLGNMRSTPWANVVTGASNTWTPVAA